MPDAEVVAIVSGGLGGRPCQPRLLLLLLVLIGSISLLSSPVEGRLPIGGVDLILSALKSKVPERQRLIALERRYATAEPTAIVFFQLRRTRGHEVDDGVDVDDDDMLTMALDSFGRRRRRASIIMRVTPEERGGDPGPSEEELPSQLAGAVLVLVLLPDLAAGQQLIRRISRTFPQETKLLLLSSPECPAKEALGLAGSALRDLWRTERVLGALVIWYRCRESHAMTVGLFDPFTVDEPPPSGSQEVEKEEAEGCCCPSGDHHARINLKLVDRGTFYFATSLDRLLPNEREPWLDLNGALLDIYGFEAAMAYRRQDIDMMPNTFPPVSNASFVPNSPKPGYFDGLFGADIEALRELASRMNFTPLVHHSRANFGFRAPNGSFTGVLGHLVTARESWLSMNVYFLKDYETRDVQFTAAVYQDSLCVFVKAAGMLPDWLLIVRCFTPALWIVVWSTVVLVSLCYVLLAQCIARHNHRRTGTTRSDEARGGRYAMSGKQPPTEEPSHPEPLQASDTVGLVGQIVGALLNAPTSGINRTTTHQKLFVAFGLIWGMTITGAFQGSLVDVYTTPTSMKNLDTLAELEASGLAISVSAPALAVDVFGNERPGSTIGNLKQRLVVEANARPTGLAVLDGTKAALIRNQDFVRLSTKYLGRDGTARLHRLQECPRSYTLAYLYPRGSPLFRTANWHILHFLQHGLYAKWGRDTMHTLAMNRALKERRLSEATGTFKTSDGENVQLRLSHLLLPFMLLSGGLFLAGVTFAWERITPTRDGKK